MCNAEFSRRLHHLGRGCCGCQYVRRSGDFRPAAIRPLLRRVGDGPGGTMAACPDGGIVTRRTSLFRR
jgi:hypothetical protein